MTVMLAMSHYVTSGRGKAVENNVHSQFWSINSFKKYLALFTSQICTKKGMNQMTYLFRFPERNDKKHRYWKIRKENGFTKIKYCLTKSGGFNECPIFASCVSYDECVSC